LRTLLRECSPFQPEKNRNWFINSKFLILKEPFKKHAVLGIVLKCNKIFKKLFSFSESFYFNESKYWYRPTFSYLILFVLFEANIALMLKAVSKQIARDLGRPSQQFGALRDVSHSISLYTVAPRCNFGTLAVIKK